MGYDIKNSDSLWVMTWKIYMGYGLWFQKHCKQTRETTKCMGYKGVWVIPGMGWFDCIQNGVPS